MNIHADKAQESKSQSVANGITQKQAGGKSTIQFIDNRPEATQHRKLRTLMTPKIKDSSNSVAQLTRMLQVQKFPDKEDKRLFRQGLQKLNATEITDWNKRDSTIQDDETIILVAHGNTDEVGDEMDRKGSLSLKPDEIANMLNTIVPDTWHGEFLLRSCDAAVTPVGGESFLERVRANFLLLRPNHQGVLSGPAGKIDYKMTQNAKVLMERFKGTGEDSEDVPYKNAMVRFHPVRPANLPEFRTDVGDDRTKTMTNAQLREWWNRDKSVEGTRVQPDHVQ